MIKRVSNIVIFIILASLAITYGWSMFQKLSHNRLVFETDTYAQIPTGNKVVIGFNINYHFDEQFELDTLSYKIINAIQNNITFPLIVVKSDSMNEALLTKVTKDQEEKVKKIFRNEVAPYHSPSSKKYKGVDIYFYSLPNNDFIISTYHKGILATSRDYKQIENFINDAFSPIDKNVTFNETNYIGRLMANSFVSVFTNNDSTRFVLAHTSKDDGAVWSGKYFGKWEQKPIEISNEEIALLLSLEHYKVDSVHWGEDSEIEIWINKSEK